MDGNHDGHQLIVGSNQIGPTSASVNSQCQLQLVSSGTMMLVISNFRLGVGVGKGGGTWF